MFHKKPLCNVLRFAFLNDGSGHSVDSGLVFGTGVHSGDVYSPRSWLFFFKPYL